MAELTIDIEELPSRPDAALVVLSGPIDASTVVGLKTRLNSALERGLGRLVLDLEKVSYINSTGLGYLITLADAAGDSVLPLVKVQPKVRVVFDMMNLGTIFRMFQTREEALGTLGAAAVVPVTATAVRSPSAPSPAPQPAASIAPAPGVSPIPASSPPRPEPAPIVSTAVPAPAPSAPTPASGSPLLRILVWTALAASAALLGWLFRSYLGLQ